MVLLSVTIRDYVISIVMTHECAHQEAHYQVAAVMMRSKTGSVISPFVVGPWLVLSALSQ